MLLCQRSVVLTNFEMPPQFSDSTEFDFIVINNEQRKSENIKTKRPVLRICLHSPAIVTPLLLDNIAPTVKMPDTSSTIP